MVTATAESVVAATVPATAVAPTTTPATVASTGATVQANVVAKPGEAVDAGAPASPTRLLSDDTKSPAKADPAQAETVKVPALSDWKLSAPEGATLAAEELAAVEAFAKENGLSQAQAEKVLGRDIAGRTAIAAAKVAEVAKIEAEWMAEAKAHPEIGGDKLDAAVANAKRALAKFATPEERKAIADSPFANNPMFLAIMNRAAAALPSEDSIANGGTASKATALSPAQIMYPHLYAKT